jgi:hypothetical protein
MHIRFNNLRHLTDLDLSFNPQVNISLLVDYS